MSEQSSRSHYLDGSEPGKRAPRVFASSERMVIQPAIEVTDAGHGATLPEPPPSVCQRLNNGDDFGIASWLKRHQTTLLTGLAIYGGYRLLRR